MTVKSIGSDISRDYATIDAWEADAPADLVTAADTWEGEVYNDSELTTTTQAQIAGITVDATHNVQLRAAAGESFMDHASAATNPLRYDASKGVGIRKTTNYGWVIQNSVHHTQFDGLQISHDGPAPRIALNLGVNSEAKNCILRGGDSLGTLGLSGGSLVVNSLVIAVAGWAVRHAGGTPAGKCINVTAIKPTDASGTVDYGFRIQYNDFEVINCMALGFDVEDFNRRHAGLGWANSSNNLSSDGSAPGTNPVINKALANQIENGALAGFDARLKTGSDAEGAGIQRTETADKDIVGQARDTSTPDIGCWEFQPASSTVTLTASLDAAVKAIDQVASTSADAAVQAARSVDASLDASIRAARSLTAAIDAAAEAANSVSTAVDASVMGDTAVSAAVDAALGAGDALSADLDAVLEAAKSAGADADAVIQAERSLSASIDAAAAAERILSASLDAVAERVLTLATAVDAYVIDPSATELTTALDSAVQKALFVAAQIEAIVRSEVSVASDIDAAVLGAVSASLSLDGAVMAVNGMLAQIDAVVALAGLGTVALDVAVEAPLVAQVGLDIVIGGASVGPRRLLVVPPRSPVVVVPKRLRTRIVN